MEMLKLPAGHVEKTYHLQEQQLSELQHLTES